MKIYFAGSIRGGRTDKKTYSKIIKLLKQYGTVLTEHLGDNNLSVISEYGLSNKNIYKRDMSLLLKSDIVVAEVTTPSLGVGYELGKAEDLKKPTLCLFKKKTDIKLSAMIAGNKNMRIEKYGSLEDVEKIFKKFISNHNK
jgi:2'-deoxynucleoside 5'-phosphate N-hydrolase